MEVTINVNDTMVEQYMLISDYLKEHPDRKDWTPIKAKMEREITELVMEKIREK